MHKLFQSSSTQECVSVSAIRGAQVPSDTCFLVSLVYCHSFSCCVVFNIFVKKKKKKILSHETCNRKSVGQDVVGIATYYRLSGLRIESRWGRDFLLPSISALGLPILIYEGYRGVPGVKAAGAWR